jgi:hypothetical protein
MAQMQITLPDNIMNVIREEAEQIGVTPNILTRIRLCSLFSECGNEGIRKSYTITLEKWREIEAYIKVKHPGSSVDSFAVKAVFSEMKKHGLNSTERNEFDRLLDK